LILNHLNSKAKHIYLNQEVRNIYDEAKIKLLGYS